MERGVAAQRIGRAFCIEPGQRKPRLDEYTLGFGTPLLLSFIQRLGIAQISAVKNRVDIDRCGCIRRAREDGQHHTVADHLQTSHSPYPQNI